MSSTITRVRRSLRGCRLRLSLGIDSFEEGFCLDLFGFLIAIPFLDRWHKQPEEMMDRWGFYYHERALVFCWGGKKSKFVYMPWMYEHIKCEVRRADGSWAKRAQSYEAGEPDQREIQVFDYRYTLRSGEVQERKATCFVERREWRQRWLTWCPLFAKVRTSLDVHFSNEVGERSGSWKGGCIGCGTDMLRGETMEDALRRMERTRKF